MPEGYNPQSKLSDSHGGYPRSGIGNANAFLTSGTPYITGSTEMAGQNNPASAGGQHLVTLPRVAREVVVWNKGTVDLRVYFADAETGTSTFDGKHYITIEGGASFEFRCKCTKIYIQNTHATTTAAYQLYAEITAVPASEMYALTGSGITIGPGDTGYS